MDTNGKGNGSKVRIGKKRGRKKGVKLWKKTLAGLPRTHKRMRGPNILESYSPDDLTEE